MPAIVSPPLQPPVGVLVRLRTAVLLAGLAGLSLNFTQAAVQQPPDLFESPVPPRIDLSINSDDWQSIQTSFASGSYHPATLKWGAAAARNVGVRSASAPAAAGRKPRLQIDTAWYVSGLTFQGLHSFSLDNLAGDASGIRRVLATRFYQRMGLPVPRTAHALVYVNNTFAGLYVLVESIEDVVARTAAAAGQRPGRTYRYNSPLPYRLDGLGAGSAAFEERFTSIDDRTRASVDDYATLDGVIRALTTDAMVDDEPRLARSVDARQFMKFAAVQSFLADPEGMVRTDGLNNFSISIRSRTDPVQFLPNLESGGLLDASQPVDRGLEANRLTQRAMRIGTLSKLYLDTLVAGAEQAERRDAPTTAIGWLEAEAGRLQRSIAGVVKVDPLIGVSDGRFERTVDQVVGFARERAAFVRCEVSRLRQSGGDCRAATRVTEPAGNMAPALPAMPRTPRATGPVTNIARGRPYTLTPAPNYAPSLDSGDGVQLTDGAYSVGSPLWTRTSTVGWTNATPVSVVIDLGSSQAIAGASFSTAAGTAGVLWPRAIFVLVSDDGRRFFPVGDLVRADGATQPPASGYAAFRFATTSLVTHGRYVAVIVDPNGPFTFCDEIEILGGDPSWLGTPLRGESTTDLQTFFVDAHVRASMQTRLTADLAAAGTALESARVSAGLQAFAARELAIAESEIAALPLQQPDTFRAVLPLNATHTRILAVHGMLRSAAGSPSLSAWVANPWDFVRPTDAPPPDRNGSGTLSIAAMPGETRSGAVNFSNATGRPMAVSLRMNGLPDASQTSLRLFESVWTDTRESVPVADALVPLPDGNPSFTIPAGMTRQIWFSFTPAVGATGAVSATLEAAADEGSRATVPMELRTLPGRFPNRPSLHVGGWDYTDAERIYGLTAANRDALVEQLQRLHVDSPWATASAMPFGGYDALGRLSVAPDTSRFDRWVARWPGANRYLVFVNAPEAIGGIAATDSRFATAVGQWIAFWVAHASAVGVEPGRLMLLLVDEPRTAAQDDRATVWGRAIKAAAPGVGIWEDPTYPDPAAAKPQLLDVSDTLGMKRSMMLQEGASYVDFFRERLARGYRLDVYGATGSARLLDPYTYYRLQAWTCAEIGATGSLFWSFVDDAGGNSWNEYRATAPSYSPFFLSADGVASSRHVEAIREGIEDFEYLAMLRQRVDALERSDPNHAGLAEARALLIEDVPRVLQAPGASEMQWDAEKDRSAAERVRLAAADLLERLRR